MRIKNISTINSDTPIKMYDIIDVNPCNNFGIVTNSNRLVISHNSVLERINSRFIVRGKVEGKLFLVSSKKTEYDFIENYINKQKGKPGIYVIDAALWEVKPTGTYSGKTFAVAVGGSNMPSKIIPDGDDVELYTRQGYRVIYPPIEFKGRFEMDLQAALMNIAGISISHVTKFITYDSIAQCYCKSKNPFTSNIISLGMKDNLAIKDFFIPELVPPEIYTMPLFIHEDMSLTGDRTGIGCVAIMGYRYQNEYDIESGDVVPTKAIIYRHVFSLGIQCPNGDEISFQKSRDFIYYLKHTLGWNIKGLSADGYQSADNKQQLITMGFKDSTIISLDRTPAGYIVLKSAFNEKRIAMLEIKELEKELVGLERDNMTGKVDHTPENSKDISDGLAGAIYNASLHADEVSLSVIEDISNISEINNPNVDKDDRQSLLDKMVSTNGKQITLKDALSDYLSGIPAPKTISDTSTNRNDTTEDISNEDDIKRRFDAVRRAQQGTGISRPSGYSSHLEDMMDMDDGIIMI